MSRHPQAPGNTANLSATELVFGDAGGNGTEASADLTFNDTANRLCVGMTQAQAQSNTAFASKSVASHATNDEQVAFFGKNNSKVTGGAIFVKDGEVTYAADFRAVAEDVTAVLAALTSAGVLVKGVRVHVDNSVEMRGVIKHVNRAVTSGHTVLAVDDVIFADATGGAFDVTLPAANGAGIAGRRYTVKRINGGGNAVTVKSAGGTLDGVAAGTGIALSAQHMSRVFQSDGTNWNIVAGYL